MIKTIVIRIPNPAKREKKSIIPLPSLSDTGKSSLTAASDSSLTDSLDSFLTDDLDPFAMILFTVHILYYSYCTKHFSIDVEETFSGIVPG